MINKVSSLDYRWKYCLLEFRECADLQESRAMCLLFDS